MVIYIVDTHAWIEYFMGSKSGIILKDLLEKENNKFISMECSLAELRGFCLRESLDFAGMYKVVKENSIILPVTIDIWLKAAETKHETRKKVKDFGLIDSILVAKQNELNCMLISGDEHFKNMKKIVYVGE